MDYEWQLWQVYDWVLVDEAIVVGVKSWEAPLQDRPKLRWWAISFTARRRGPFRAKASGWVRWAVCKRERWS
jgi:hypothetical protein